MRKAAILIAALATGCFGRGRNERIANTAISITLGIILETIFAGQSDERATGPLCDPHDPRPPPHGCPALPGEPPLPPPPDPKQASPER